MNRLDGLAAIMFTLAIIVVVFMVGSHDHQLPFAVVAIVLFAIQIITLHAAERAERNGRK